MLFTVNFLITKHNSIFKALAILIVLDMVINDSPFEGEICSWYAVNSPALKVLAQRRYKPSMEVRLHTHLISKIWKIWQTITPP